MIILVTLVLPQPATSLDCALGAVNWDGGGNGSTWTDPLNWDTDTVPGPADDVCIDTGVPITVAGLGHQAVRSLVSTDNIDIGQFDSLTLTGQSEISGHLNLTGTLDGGSDLTLAGTTSWFRGRLDGTVTNTGRFDVEATGLPTISGAFTNAAGAEFRHTTREDLFLIAGTASFTNNGTHEFVVDGADVHRTGSGAEPVYTNTGTVLKSGGTGTNQFSSHVDFVNNGDITVVAGEIRIAALKSSAPTNFTVAGGANLELSGDNATISGVFSSTGGGSVEWAGGTWVATGAILDFGAAAPLLWNGRLTIDGTISNRGTLEIGGSGAKTITGTFTNTGGGTVRLVGSGNADVWLRRDVATPAHFENRGLVEFASTLVDITATGAGANPMFTNAPGGRVRNAPSAGTNQLLVDFDNGGVIDVDIGTLVISSFVASTATTFEVQPAALLDLRASDAAISGRFSSAGGGTVEWDGTWVATGVTLDFNEAPLSFTGRTLTGDVSNVGVVVLTGGSKTIGGSFTNQGTGVVRHDTTGVVFLARDLMFINDGIYDLRTDSPVWTGSGGGADPSFVNNGTLTKSAGTGRSEFINNIDFTNTGVIEVHTGQLDIDDLDSSTATTFLMGDGTRLELTGDAADISGRFATTGPGTETVTWRGTFLPSAPTIFDFDPGVFTLRASVDATGTTLTNANEVTWTSSGHTVTGEVSNQGLLVMDGGSRTIGGSFTNERSGVVRHQTGSVVSLAPDMTFVNGGIYDLRTDSPVWKDAGPGADPSFANNGTLTKSAGSGRSEFINTIDFTNTGVIEVHTGQLHIKDSTLAQLPATVFTGGTWRVFEGSTLDLSRFASITEIGAGATVELSGVGSEFVPLEDITTNTGSLTITDGASFTTAGDLTSTGELVMGPAGILNVAGNFTENSTNSLHLQVEDVSSSGRFGRIIVANHAFLHGVLELELVAVFTPVPGDAHDVIFWATDERTGTFSQIIDTAGAFDETFLPDRLRLNLLTNDPPELRPIGEQTGDEETEITFTAIATDPNGDTLTFTLEGAAPPGASIDPNTGVFAWTPTEAQGPGTVTVTVRVTDDGEPAMWDEDTFDITVNEVNVAPVLNAIPDQMVDEETNLTFTATASDADLPANTLIFNLVDPPPGAFIHPLSGVFNWRPNEAQGPDTYTITVRVRDNGSPVLDDTVDVQVTVNETNGAPTLDPIQSPQFVDEGSPLAFTAMATDPDTPPNALTFSFSLGSTPPAPTGAGIDPVTGAFTWTPPDSDQTRNIQIVVTDDGTPPLSDQQTVHISVANVDPSVEAGDDQTVPDGSTVSLQPATYTDPGSTDTHTATVDWGDGPPENCSISPSCTVVPNGDGTGIVTGSHLYPADGRYTVTVTVNDDDGGSGSDSFMVQIDNNPPVAEAGGPYSVVEGDTVRLDGTGSSDVDGSVTTYLWSPAGVADRWSIDDASLARPTLTGIDDAVGTITLTVNDEDMAPGDDSTDLEVTNADPVVTAGPDQTVTEGDLVTLDPSTFTDAGTKDTHTALVDWGDTTSDPGIVTEAEGDGSVAASHVYTTPGTFTVTVTVTDDDGGSHFDTFEVTVDDAPGAIRTTKTVDVAGVAEPGGPVTYTITVLNVSALDDTTVNTVDDPMLGGDVTAFCDQPVPVTLAPTEMLTCIVPGAVAGNAGDVVTNTATASGIDSDGLPVSDDGAATVTITDVPPDISVTKTASASAVREPGAAVTFTFTVTNNAAEEATLDSLTDDMFEDLHGQGDCSLPRQLTAGGGSYTCSITRLIEGGAGDTHINTVTATASDDEANVVQATADARVEITAGNNPPVAVDDDYTIDEDARTSLPVLSNDFDPNGDPIIILVASQPAHGSLVVSGHRTEIVYTPDPNFSGQDRFEYSITDRANTHVSTATVTITVTPINDPPVLDPIGDRVVDELIELSFTASASDPDVPLQTLTFGLDPGAPSGASIDPATGQFSWTPTEDQGPGDHKVTIRVTDDGNPHLSDAETITITVNEVDQPPPALMCPSGDRVDVIVEFPGPRKLIAGATIELSVGHVVPEGTYRVILGTSDVGRGRLAQDHEQWRVRFGVVVTSFSEDLPDVPLRDLLNHVTYLTGTVNVPAGVTEVVAQHWSIEPGNVDTTNRDNSVTPDYVCLVLSG